MPLPPLSNDDSFTVRLWRNFRVAIPVTFWFGFLGVINLTQTLSLVIKPFSAAAFRRVNRWCAGTWWGGCVIFSERFNGQTIVISGEELPSDENVLVLSNHQQMPDIPAIMKFARTKDRLGDLKFFVKKQLKWVPGMGWGMQFLDCLFIDRDWTADRETIRKTFSRLVDDKVPVYLVSFVEGTRLTLPKLAAAQDYARSHGLRPPVHTLVPRTKGFVASVEGLRSHIDAVYDLTIAYDDAVPSLWQYLKRLVRRIHVHVRRFPVADLPPSADDLRQWLLDRWHEKDDLLEHFYATGAFPQQADPGS